ncbi:DUF2076 family protein [Saccharibacter sp. 17.LH.SD]|uniref:DUF2076 domain-containing protein n=1 Tax=Saccharibacter sp. 17.LH.SD TaxID=2689393 RepID=UPI0013698553|nr:DUF2076 domain-containing protein [Saccharibacter sp. 17.LH.SD]MXV44033.1 DUF2076 family protein [Saccharibacter sp. 17.LH.SD]
MNSEERDVISRFFARVGGGQNGDGTQANLPAIDPEADRFIAENFQQYPAARYRVTQLAVVQEAALAQAQNRIRDLEMQLQQARSQQAQASQSSGGFLSNMFGRPSQPQQPRSSALPPGWGPAAGAGAPGVAAGSYNAAAPSSAPSGMFARSGSGFLGSALSTAAGVAGGMMAANALEGLFSDHHGHDGGAGADAQNQGDTFITNNYGDTFGGASSGDQGGDPFGGSGTDASGFTPQDFGGQDTVAPEDTGGGDSGGFDGGGFDDNSSF